MSSDDIGDIDDMPPLMDETPIAEIKLIEEQVEEAETSTIEEAEVPLFPRQRFTSPEPPRRQWRREIPQFDWNDAIEAEMTRFTPIQYIQYTFEATVFVGLLFPRMVLVPASVMMTQHFIDLARQVAMPNGSRDDEKVVKTIALLLLLLINVYYMGRILGLIE